VSTTRYTIKILLEIYNASIYFSGSPRVVQSNGGENGIQGKVDDFFFGCWGSEGGEEDFGEGEFGEEALLYVFDGGESLCHFHG
jgi:hypothetical protein